MGIYDRDYMSGKNSGSGFGPWSVVVWLLGINVVCFILQHLIFDHTSGTLVSLSGSNLLKGEAWRLLTYQFCHANTGHFLANMLFLFFLGRMALQELNERLLLRIYLFGGLAGGLLHVIWGFITESPNPVIGASASVIAVFTALVARVPEQPISLLFLPVQFKMKYFAWFLLATNLLGLMISTLTGGGTVSYVSHLGGMALGWFYIRTLGPALERRNIRTENRRNARQRNSPQSTPSQTRPAGTKDSGGVYLDREIDSILEKISAHGIHSLTPEEKRILEKGSETLARKLDDKDRK